MQGFRPLTDPVKLNQKPERVRIKTIANGMTLARAFRQYTIPDSRQEEFAILNGMKLTDNQAKGTLIKIITE